MRIGSLVFSKRLTIGVQPSREVRAVTYVADRRHPQYAGRLPVEDLTRLVRQGIGISGANPDYVQATHAQLIEMGVSDPILAGIAERLAEPRG